MLSVQPAQKALLVFHLNTICQENKKRVLLVTLTLRLRCITVTPQFQHPRILNDLFWLSEIQVWARSGRHDTCYLHLTLVSP